MKNPISKFDMEKVHVAIPDAYDQMIAGRISRREFIRFSTLLGMSATMAVACGGAVEEEAAPVVEKAEEVMEEEVMEEKEEEVMEESSSGIKRGGVLTIGGELQLIDHPARLSWVEGSNVVRQVAEYLTLTRGDNITIPWLLESWEANDTVDVWTLNLRQGIMFNNGDELTADDIMFNFGQWLDPEVGSSMLGLLSYLEEDISRVEKIDDYTIRMNLASPNIGVPEHLFHYPAAIMHRDFEGDFLKSPVGTGAFTLEEYSEGERAIVKARADYWKKSESGEQLPYLDEVQFISLGKDASAAGMQANQLDTFYNPGPAQWEALKDIPGILVQPAQTAQTVVLRMRVDRAPWDDVRVRNALKLCQDRAKILDLAWFGEGDLGRDAHIAPVHPAYPTGIDIPEKDIDAAKALLEEWAADTGGELPIKATLVTKNDEGEDAMAQVLKEDAALAGFDLELDITEASGYWERWDEVDLGITAWTHRPLDTMVLPLAYIAGADGSPVPWNETRWVDEEFSATLSESEGTLDVAKRKELMEQLMNIFWERGPIGISFFKSAWRITKDDVMGFEAHPTAYDLLNETWINRG